MNDNCAVCAGNLDWVAYGACGHSDVCSTCVVRLRFICNDRRCCICKTESNVIFVTKALGDYTSTIKDFSVLPYDVKEGQADSYWYHEDTQAFFDDVDHYEIIKAMCRLSCNECDKMEHHHFTNIEQLRGHLSSRHKLLMCSLCLEGRKAFVCEQKLYTPVDLNQHINSGNSEIDGTECERGGFMGHPKCGFCRTAFYGESELYSHMSREHYKCHICQRQHPGQCKYYKNYNDLENHFRRDHYQCEDDACLAKKFMVFPSLTELKRHNTSEHGGRMSRPQRNAALQIPTNSQNHRSNEYNLYGREQIFRRRLSDNDYQHSRAIEESLGTSNLPKQSSSVQGVSAHRDTNDIDPLVHPKHSSENNTKEAHDGGCWKNKNKRPFSSAQAWPETSRRLMKGSSSSRHDSNPINIAVVARTIYASSSHARHVSNFPLASAAQRHKQSSSDRVLRIVEQVETTNKSLVENMLNRY